MKNTLSLVGLSLLALAAGCQSFEDTQMQEVESSMQQIKKQEHSYVFSEAGSIILTGGSGAAEISAFDPLSKRLFVVNNAGSSRIDVINLQDPAMPQFIESIDLTAFGGGVNSVAVGNGLLVAAVEANVKQENGSILVFDAADLGLIKQIEVGALPDMVTFSPDGAYILSANEGEPNADYSVDPYGTVSIISVLEGFQTVTLDFTKFNNQQNQLMAEGLRIFGPNASLAMDVEPEYIAVSEDSHTAWVTLQENNAVARIDLHSKSITDLFPMVYKDYSQKGNAFDGSDRDGKFKEKEWPVLGLYMPDAVAAYSVGGVSYYITANEGDAREYDAFEEEARIKDVQLDPQMFPNRAMLQQDDKLGRLKITDTMGDVDGDGDYDQLYAFGSRSFSIWNGSTGQQLYDSGNALEQQLVQAGLYDDSRSDDKGAEPEGVAIGVVNGKTLAFIGSERADAVLVYDVSNPSHPRFLQVLATGDAPEGISFIPAESSPNGRSLLIVSSEGDGQVKIYQAGLVL